MSNRDVFCVFVLTFFIGVGTCSLISDSFQEFLLFPVHVATKYVCGLVLSIMLTIRAKRK